MMLVRSTILMPSSAPGIVLSWAGRGGETAIALTWRHAVGDCDAKLGGNHAQRCALCVRRDGGARRSRDFRRRHVSGVRADRDTTCCDDGTWPQFAKDVRCERLPQARPSRRHDDPKRGETSCVVICVKPEAAVTEKELVEFRFVHLGNCKRPGKVCCVTIPCLKRPSARSSARSCASRSGSVASGWLQATDRYALPRRRG